MARLVLGVIAALIVGFAVWAALPTSRPLAAPITDRRANASVRRTAGAVTDAHRGRRTISTRRSPAASARSAPSPPRAHSVTDRRRQASRPTPPSSSRGCAPLYQQPACRDAMMHFDDPPPEKRSIAVLQACARVYCPILSAPKPAVCARPDAVPEDEQQFIAWNELRAAILTHDIGAAAAQAVLSPRARGAR